MFDLFVTDNDVFLVLDQMRIKIYAQLMLIVGSGVLSLLNQELAHRRFEVGGYVSFLRVDLHTCRRDLAGYLIMDFFRHVCLHDAYLPTG